MTFLAGGGAEGSAPPAASGAVTGGSGRARARVWRRRIDTSLVSLPSAASLLEKGPFPRTSDGLFCPPVAAASQASAVARHHAARSAANRIGIGAPLSCRPALLSGGDANIPRAVSRAMPMQHRSITTSATRVLPPPVGALYSILQLVVAAPCWCCWGVGGALRGEGVRGVFLVASAVLQPSAIAAKSSSRLVMTTDRPLRSWECGWEGGGMP